MLLVVIIYNAEMQKSTDYRDDCANHANRNDDKLVSCVV